MTPICGGTPTPEGASELKLVRMYLDKKTEAMLYECTISMAVDRLGGTVEGQPTTDLNFLQRIDELRAIEARLEGLSAPNITTPEDSPE